MFKDPEELSKGRFYNCIAGWQCEVTNTKKLYAYGLLKDFTNFRPWHRCGPVGRCGRMIKRKR
ncbi:MAG: glycine betaine ABC transporter substrate-binding protein [Hyphomicrobiaceae bacterium]